MAKVIILVGPSGAGKSTYIEKLITLFALFVCSADHYFVDYDTGKYNFDPTKLGKAHGLCLQSFINYLSTHSAELIVVDNTNVEISAIAPYIAVAQAYDAEIEVVVFDTPVDVCIKRATHGASSWGITRQYEAMNKMLGVNEWPRYWPKPTHL
jgi:predicted kinase